MYEAVFLLDEMIRQIIEKENYSVSSMKDHKALDDISVKDPKARALSGDLINIRRSNYK
jgi:hypothetical protein